MIGFEHVRLCNSNRNRGVAGHNLFIECKYLEQCWRNTVRIQPCRSGVRYAEMKLGFVI